MERSHETNTRIAATSEEVWRAISEAEQITKWFSPHARVQPGPDGSTVGRHDVDSWGPGVEARGWSRFGNQTGDCESRRGRWQLITALNPKMASRRYGWSTRDSEVT